MLAVNLVCREVVRLAELMVEVKAAWMVESWVAVMAELMVEN